MISKTINPKNALFLFVAIIFLFAPNLSRADEEPYSDPFTIYVNNYFKELENQKSGVFISMCNNGTEKEILIFPFDKKKGLLIEMAEDEVVNLGTVTMSDDGPKVSETHAGFEVHESAARFVKELADYDFKLVKVGDIKNILKIKSHRICKSK
jgi:hypothetical protein